MKTQNVTITHCGSQLEIRLFDATNPDFLMDIASLRFKGEGLARDAVHELFGIFNKMPCTCRIEREDIFEHLDTFISKPVSVREEVYEYLAEAKHYIQQDAPEGAIWRLEEALKLLRRMAEKEDKQ